MYSTFSQLFQQYQFENSCTAKIADCFQAGDDYHNDKIYKQLEKHLNIVDRIYPNSNLSNVKWLPKTCKAMNGEDCQHTWYGVWNAGTNPESAFFTLADGSILSICIPFGGNAAGFIFFDTNGQKGPNRVGKDQFPMGVGAYNNPKYINKVHPYFNNNWSGGNRGLCNISNNNECNPNVCTQESCSPTAYILKYGKLPHINW